jgi:murein DD-endopeptidase MepM/ murein hydrolase activator NlpD
MTTVLKVAILGGVAVGLLQSAQARKSTVRRPIVRPLSLDVEPTPEIDARIAEEVGKARKILEGLDTNNLCASPYLVSAIYYHDDFLTDFPVDRRNAAPERRIIGQISRLLSASQKAGFLRLLHELWARSGSGIAEGPAAPVSYSRLGGGHASAVDLFAREGTPVRTVSRGIVVLADRDWRPDDLFSTTSRKGGNAVIVFDPDHDRFFRYCHLSTVEVSAGSLVSAGQAIAAVGHSGLNASRPGHGRHLHFEINQYRDGRVAALGYRQLRALLRKWRR